MRLVDDNDALPALYLVLRDPHAEVKELFLYGRRLALRADLVVYGLYELYLPRGRLKQHCREDLVGGEPLQELKEECRLARACRAFDQDRPCMLPHGLEERLQCRGLPGRGEGLGGIGAEGPHHGRFYF